MRAEISVNEKELASICEQLSAELGITVNADNLEQIYDAKVAEIENTLKTGIEIMQRIQQEAGQCTAQEISSQASDATGYPQQRASIFGSSPNIGGMSDQQMGKSVQPEPVSNSGFSMGSAPETSEDSTFGNSATGKTLFSSNHNPVGFPGFDI